jgi:hypothetical protein
MTQVFVGTCHEKIKKNRWVYLGGKSKDEPALAAWKINNEYIYKDG